MNHNLTVTGFVDESQVRRAVSEARARNWIIVDIYSPYALHGVEELLGRRRSRLPVACFLGGMAGLLFTFWLQFWTSTSSWPLNVGGRPWNSLPAFVPVAFEGMVLLAGFSLVGAFLFRCRLYPGKSPPAQGLGVTDDRFALVLRAPVAPAEVRETLRGLEVVCIEGTTEASLS